MSIPSTNVLTAIGFAVAVAGLGLAAWGHFGNHPRISASASSIESAPEPQEAAAIVLRRPRKGGGLSRFLSGLFAIWAVLAFLYAEGSWDATEPRDGMIGVGASAYAMTQYARAIALACLSAAFAVIGRPN